METNQQHIYTYVHTTNSTNIIPTRQLLHSLLARTLASLSSCTQSSYAFDVKHVPILLRTHVRYGKKQGDSWCQLCIRACVAALSEPFEPYPTLAGTSPHTHVRTYVQLRYLIICDADLLSMHGPHAQHLPFMLSTHLRTLSCVAACKRPAALKSAGQTDHRHATARNAWTMLRLLVCSCCPQLTTVR